MLRKMKNGNRWKRKSAKVVEKWNGKERLGCDTSERAVFVEFEEGRFNKLHYEMESKRFDRFWVKGGRSLTSFTNHRENWVPKTTPFTAIDVSRGT
jgi:hypothetical protein